MNENVAAAAFSFGAGGAAEDSEAEKLMNLSPTSFASVSAFAPSNPMLFQRMLRSVSGALNK
jgi:hypothetical protein